jgi:hypothetical protein
MNRQGGNNPYTNRKRIEYENSTYYQITKAPYFKVFDSRGTRGEYLTFLKLKPFEEIGAKLLFNLYIPKGNGQTTEIDILMICAKGIFVVESKNYIGWIFGDDKQRQWCQVLRAKGRKSRKEFFYNPVMQNSSHIKHLKSIVGYSVPMRSVIVFSDKCSFKKMDISSDDVWVVKTHGLFSAVDKIYSSTSENILTDEQITELYCKLYPYTQTDDTLKLQHISNIKNLLDK